MTLDELVFLQSKLAAGGCPVEQIVTLGALASEWRAGKASERRARRAAAGGVPMMNNAAAPASNMNNAAAPEHASAVSGAIPDGGPARVMFQALRGLRRSGAEPTTILVGEEILSFYNQQSKRCDPSYGAIAVRLKISERAVRRAVARLDAPRPGLGLGSGRRREKPGLGLILVVPHAGSRHQNAYRPQWGALLALAGDDAKMNNAATAPMRPPVAANAAAGGPQTRVLNKTLSVPVERLAHVRSHPDPRQREIFFPFVKPAEAARSAAERRVIDDIARQAKRQPSFNVSALSAVDWDDVHAAEVARRGEGIVTIHRLLGTGPPKLASG